MPHLAQVIGFSDFLLVLIYLMILAYLGWLGYRRTKTAADYLLAGRRVHPFVMAMSYGATFISTSAIVGFGGVAGLFGMSLLWLTFCNIFVGIFIAFVVLGGPTRRMGHRLDAHTFPELMGRRFDSRFIQVLAGLVIFLFMPLYAAAVLIGGSEFLSIAFGIDYTVALFLFAIITAIYVFFGGLKGVLYTDTFQGIIMTLGMLALLVFTYYIVGGVTHGHQTLTEMKGEVFPGFKGQGHQGWTSMPLFGWGWGPDGAAKPSPYNLWWIVVSTLVMGVGIGVLAQPQLIVRFMTVKSGREFNRALVYGGSFILLMTGVAFTVGALSNTYFFHQEIITGQITKVEQAEVIAKRDPGQKPATILCRLVHLSTRSGEESEVVVVAEGIGKVAAIMPKALITDVQTLKTWEGGQAADAAAAPLDTWVGQTVTIRPRATAFTRSVIKSGQEWMFNTDSIIPTFITSAMPSWFRVLFLLTLLSAAMSTMSSQYHSLGTSLGRDVFEQLFPNRKATDTQGSDRTIYVVRVGIIIGLILAATIGYYTRGGYFIARATAIFFGLCGSAFLPTFVLGLFWKRMTKAGAIASMIVGLTITAFWLVFVKEAEAGSIGLVRLITDGKNSILASYPNWPVVDPLLVALPLSLLTAVVVSLFTKAPSADHLQTCFGPSQAEQSVPA